mgnify:CR=1 FL=1
MSESAKILLVDDQPANLDVLRHVLEREGYQVLLAPNGEVALRNAARALPDLILLDVMMPDASGFDICRKLKTTTQTRNIPVIFLTGASDVDQKVLGFDVGAVDYIQKPFDSVELNTRVRAALRTKRFQDKLAQSAMIDGLTGLWNRAHFDQRIHEEVAAALRYDRPMSLIMMDVDKFKNLNDNHGHLFGDEVLQVVGDVLQDSVRTSDWPCRYGGEEFGLILRETDLDGAIILAERIRKEIGSLQLHNKAQLVPVTSSFGVVSSTLCMNPCDLSSKWMIGSADRALYAAKEGGRNCVRTAERR